MPADGETFLFTSESVNEGHPGAPNAVARLPRLAAARQLLTPPLQTSCATVRAHACLLHVGFWHTFSRLPSLPPAEAACLARPACSRAARICSDRPRALVAWEIMGRNAVHFPRSVKSLHRARLSLARTPTAQTCRGGREVSGRK